jgi:5-carboxymethyl-2-hydroxymuconate isomerase
MEVHMYEPETEFRSNKDGTMIYNLKQHGWRQGEPLMINDVYLNVSQQILQGEVRDSETVKEIAEAVCAFLNEKYPVIIEEDEHYIPLTKV